MTTIVTRQGKGSPLSWVEVDANFTNLNAAVIDAATALGTSNTPAGNISATTVQTAINELDTEKAPSAASTAVGTSFNPSGGVVATDVQAAIVELDTEKAPTSAGTAVGTSFTPAGNIAAINVQTALEELDAEKALLSSGVPAGAMQMFFMNSAPTGWLAADGAIINRTTYATLFTAIGITYGAGDGSTTFQLPDMRGYFPRASGTNSDGTVSGTFGVKQSSQTGSHTHTIAQPNAAASVGGIVYGNSGVTGVNSANSTETRPANIPLLCCIKT